MRFYSNTVLSGNAASEAIELQADGFSTDTLPDSPEAEMQLAAEIAAMLPSYEPTAEELEAEYQRLLAGQRPADADVAEQPRRRAFHLTDDERAVLRASGKALEARVAASKRRDGRDPYRPTAGAIWPEVVTWTDEQLITAIEIADTRNSALNWTPAQYDALLDEASAEMVRRLQSRALQLAA